VHYDVLFPTHRYFNKLLLADVRNYEKLTGLISLDNEDMAKTMTAALNKEMRYLQLPTI
jgi:hypothetical protein